MKKAVAIAVLCLLTALIFFATYKKSVSPHASTESDVDTQARTMIIVCDSSTLPDTCFSNRFSELAQKKSLMYTLSVLSALQQMKEFHIGCHLIAHTIAFEEVSKDPQAWKELLQHMPVKTCSGGFIMGTMEARYIQDTNLHIDATTLEHICHEIDSQNTPAVDETCMHTMGHVIFAEHVGDFDAVVSICGQTSKEYQYECYSGAFMEALYGRIMHHATSQITWTPDVLKSKEDACNRFSGSVGQACWRELAHMIVDVMRRDPEAVYRECHNATTQAQQTECNRHAFAVLALTSRFPSREMSTICSSLTDASEKKLCIYTVMQTIVANVHDRYTTATDYCKSLPQEEFSMCTEVRDATVSH